MNSENVGLSRDHRVKWIAHMIQCSGTEYDRIVTRLSQLSYASLMRIDAAATMGHGDSIGKELLTEDDTDLIVDSCDLMRKHGHHHSVSNIKDVLSALKAQGYNRNNLLVHLDARSSYHRVMKSDSSTKYSENLPLVALVEENPQRMEEIMEFISERETSDIDLVRAFLEGAAPLAEGTL